MGSLHRKNTGCCSLDGRARPPRLLRTRVSRRPSSPWRSPQRAGPRPVVEQDALRDGRVVGGHLLEEVGVVGEPGAEEVEQEATQHLVDRADRPGLRHPPGVDPRRGQESLVHPPEQVQPVPLGEGGHRVQEPAHAVGQILVVGLGREEPVRGALDNNELGGALRTERSCGDVGTTALCGTPGA